MRIILFTIAAAAATTVMAVEQADLVWKKPVEAHTTGMANVQGPFFLAGGRIAVVSENRMPGDKPTHQLVLTFFNPDSTVLRTMLIGGAEAGNAWLGAAATDMAGKIYVISRMEKDESVHLHRFSPAGDEESNQELKGETSSFPTGLLIERSGDMFVSGIGAGIGIAYLSRTNASGAAGWRYGSGKLLADAWRPSKITSDQKGNVIIAGVIAKDGPVRVAKVDPKGEKVFSVDLPETKDVAGLLVDPDGKVVVLAKSETDGALLFSLDPEDGHSVWVETKLNTADIEPKDAIMDARRFIYILLDSKEEGVVRSYVVRYSLGGTPLENLRPTNDGSRAGSLAMDSVGEVYVTAITKGGQLVVSRSASNLNARYAIRSSPGVYDGAKIAVRDEDGAMAIITLRKDDQGDLYQPYLFRGRQAPVAKYDTYKAVANTQNNLPTVLGNDSYLEGAQMSITQRPANGKLEMQADGSFLYTPRSGFTGKDTFRYQLTRGTLAWYAAIVTLNVE